MNDVSEQQMAVVTITDLTTLQFQVSELSNKVEQMSKTIDYLKAVLEDVHLQVGLLTAKDVEVSHM